MMDENSYAQNMAKIITDLSHNDKQHRKNSFKACQQGAF